MSDSERRRPKARSWRVRARKNGEPDAHHVFLSLLCEGLPPPEGQEQLDWPPNLERTKKCLQWVSSLSIDPGEEEFQSGRGPK